MTPLTPPRSEATGAALHRIGPIRLSPGVTVPAALRYFGVASILACLGSFMAVIQPYVFTEQLHIPAAVQGRLAGNLAGVQQMAGLIFIVLLGALTDRLGRKVFLVTAMVGMTAAILLYPLATAVLPLFLFRFLFGFGSACNTAGGPPMRLGLTDNRSRGRFLSLSLVFQAAFALVFVSFLGTRMPAWLVSRGAAPVWAGRYTIWLVGILGLFGILLAVFGLRRDRPAASPRGGDLVRSALGHVRGTGRNLFDVLRYARRNPRFGLLLFASAVVRADSLVLTSFLALWMVNAGRGEGLTTAAAMKGFGGVAVLLSVTDVVFGAAAGFLTDRVDRMRMLISAVALTAVAFALTVTVPSVRGPTIFFVIAFINLGEALQLSASQALIGEETPDELRGSAYGVFAWTGMISVVVISFVCGYLFDLFGYKTPFYLMSGLSFGFLLFAVPILLRRRAQNQLREREA